MKQRARNEDAVSPVIGIMLMLVVTIIIAAVITGFATDLTADTESTPMAVFDVAYINPSAKSDGVDSIGFKHKGGDAIPLNDLVITVEQIGGGNDGFVISYNPSNVKSQVDYGISLEANSYPLVVLGQEEKITEALVSTGDIIHLVPTPAVKSNEGAIVKGCTAVWTISHSKTNGVIAKGEFVVPKA